MNEAHRQLQLQRIRDAIAHADRPHSDEEVAAAEAFLASARTKPQQELPLREAA